MNTLTSNELVIQYNKERFSADLYRSLAYDMNLLSLMGAYSYYSKRACEEQEHAHKFAEWMLDQGVMPNLDAMDAIDTNCKSLLDAATAQLEHEKFITASIKDIYVKAKEIGDDTVCAWLDKWLLEQVEEEDESGKVLDWCRLAGNDPAAILQIDERLGESD